ncbi:MAG: radical SAM protein [Halanaerobiales bacterium]|nr:radical SAM protein [Halanaerobiales bacterium]
MYYINTGTYIKNNVLFDLRNLCTYKINNDVLEIFNNLYNNIDTPDMEKHENYEEIKKNFFSNNLDKIKKNKKDINDIINIQIKVSNTCNLKCTYCYANQGNYGKEDSIMSQTTAKKIAQKINELFPKVKKVSFFGGEPLLNIDGIETIVNTLDNKEIKYSMVTNGTIFNAKLLNLLKKYDMTMIISIDGPKEINDLNRINNFGHGTYDVIASNIDEIQKKANAVGMLVAVYTKPGYEKYSKKELYEFLYKRFKVKAIGIGEVFTEIEELQLPDNLNIKKSPKEIVEFTLNKIMNEEFFIINEVYDILTSFFNQVSMSQFCGAGIMSLFIDEEGNVCPCQLFTDDEDFYMGNILHEHLQPYNQTENYITVRNKLKNVRKGSINECDSCIARFWCFRCIGMYKSEKNFGACKDINECTYNTEITIETLNKLSEYINEDKFTELMQKINILSSAITENAFLATSQIP